MRKTYSAIILFCLLALVMPAVAQQRAKRNAAAEAAEQPKSFVERVRDDYKAFYAAGGVFEKLYVVTDKPYYSAGERMHYSGFLVHATFLTRFSESEFIYVELISPDGRLLERQKICADRRQFVGSFNLSARLSSGKYTLRAYSRWMTNFDTGYFYTREVRIGNYIDDAILTSVTYQSADNGTVTARVRLADQFSIPFSGQPVRYRTLIDGRYRNGSAKTDDKGIIEIKFKPSDNDSDGIELNVRANSRDLSRFVQMPSFSTDFDVAFCPEGGNLIGGTLQIVAFKAIRPNGRSVAVTGKIYDESGNFVTDIVTEHKGMGRFVMHAKAGVKYYAECTSPDGLSKRFGLPVVEPSGVSLRLFRRVGGYTFVAQPTADLNIADFAAVVHSRGAVMTVIEDLSRPSRLLDSDLFDGIAQISIVHKPTLKIVAERLFYVNDRRYAKAEIEADKAEYNRRELVSLRLALTDSDGRPAKGNFTLAVTDADDVPHRSGAGNIFSYLLLSSDLKGEVEDAGSYFSDEGAVSPERIDLVMLTNGWRRYSLRSVLAHEHPRIIYPVEESQRIIGSVFGLFGRARKPSIVVMEPDTKYVEAFELNDANNFVISGLDAFSTTTYIVQALNKKGKDTTVSIKIESENYPLVVGSHRRESLYETLVDTIPTMSLSRAKEKYYADGGEKVIDIEEVVVIGRRRSPFFAAGNTGTMIHGDLSRYGSVYDALSTFKELDVFGTTITTRPQYVTNDVTPNVVELTRDIGDDSDEVGMISTIHSMDNDLRTPDLYVNGEMADLLQIDSYEMKYVERLNFVDGRAAYMLGLSAPMGAIMMQVSPEGLKRSWSSDAMARVVVRGCNKPEEFYKPKYETLESRLAEGRDLRSTIAWEPLIRPDSAGMAEVWFYTADRSGRYDVVLEGITDEGELCRKQTLVEVVSKPIR